MTETLYDEQDCLPLSGIQHFAFCQRQFALIHVEQSWSENALTFEGRLMHDRADDPFYFESRGTLLITRAVPLISQHLGLYGVADVVEFHLVENHGIALEGQGGMWRPYPVEYKRGQQKPDDRDIVQLAAQALCLEEMMKVQVPRGALFYGKTRRRQIVNVDTDIRVRVRDLADQMHRVYEGGITPPPPKDQSRCRNCSLKDLCLPKLASKQNVRSYIRTMLRDEDELR